MDMHHFSQINLARCEAPNGFNHKLRSWSLSDWMTAVMGELGEAANVVKKLNRIRDGIPGNKQTETELWKMLEEEIADAFIYLDLLARAADIVLEQAVLNKFNATSQKLGCPITIPLDHVTLPPPLCTSCGRRPGQCRSTATGNIYCRICFEDTPPDMDFEELPT